MSTLHNALALWVIGTLSTLKLKCKIIFFWWVPIQKNICICCKFNIFVELMNEQMDDDQVLNLVVNEVSTKEELAHINDVKVDRDGQLHMTSIHMRGNSQMTCYPIPYILTKLSSTQSRSMVNLSGDISQNKTDSPFPSTYQLVIALFRVGICSGSSRLHPKDAEPMTGETTEYKREL
ncbi:hypothetical protein STEG23_013387, partial [Scotinomys teguina]